MAKESRIPFEEFTTHIQQVFERIIRDRETIIVETDDAEVVTLHAGEPEAVERPGTGAKTEADYRAFLASAGSWYGLDVEAFLNDIYASRDHGSRPSVEL